MKNKKLVKRIGMGVAAALLIAVSFLSAISTDTNASKNSTIELEYMDEYLESVPQEVKETIKVYMVKMLEENDGLTEIMSPEMFEKLCNEVANTIKKNEMVSLNEETISKLLSESLTEIINKEVEKQLVETITTQMNNATVSQEQINNVTSTVKKEILTKLDGYATMDQVQKMIESAISNSSNGMSSSEVTTLINETIKSNTYLNYLINNLQGINGEDGKDGKDGKDGYSPVKGVDYLTDEDIKEIAGTTAEEVNRNYMTTIVNNVVEKLMIDGEITLSTYEEDVINAIVEKLMKETTSTEYIKEQVLNSVEDMIISSLAKEYEPGKEYVEGNTVTYNKKLYICITSSTTSSPDDSSAWEQTTLTDIVASLTERVEALKSDIDNEMNSFETELGNKLDEQDVVIQEITNQNTTQDEAIKQVQDNDLLQDEAISSILDENKTQDETITNIQGNNDAQDATIADVEANNDLQDERLSALEGVTYDFSNENGNGKLKITINR